MYYYDQRVDNPDRFINLRSRSLEAIRTKRCLDVLPVRSYKLLDIGCGSGLFTRTLANERPDYALYGCDTSEVLIDYARSFNDGIEYKLADINEPIFENDFFDAIVGFDIIEHIPDPESTIMEMARILKPGGIMHFFVPTEGNFFTIQWFAWKLFPDTLTMKAYGGHLAPIKTKQLINWAHSSGLKPLKIKYSYHFVGQLQSWLLMLPHKAKKLLKVEKKNYIEQSDDYERTDRFIFKIKSIKDKALGLLDCIAYYEATLFSRFRLFSMGTHITLIKPIETQRK